MVFPNGSSLPTPSPPSPSTPPTPPPPTESARYMLTIPFHSSLGFELEPLLPSHDPSRCTGAKVSNIDPQNDRNRKHNVQMGDAIYKIDGIVTKTRSFNSILDKIRSDLHPHPTDGNDRSGASYADGVRFTFERQQIQQLTQRHSQYQHQQNQHNTLLSASKEDKTTYSNINEQYDEHTYGHYNEHYNSQASPPTEHQQHPRTLKKPPRRPAHLNSPSSVDMSGEVNVLDSVFDRRTSNRQQQDQQLDTSDYQIHNHDGHGIDNTDTLVQSLQRREQLTNSSSPCSNPPTPIADLVAIPECEALGESKDNDDAYGDGNNKSCSPGQSLLPDRQRQCDNPVDHHNTDLNSMAFDYSYSTHNTNLRSSPRGTTITPSSNSEQSQNLRPRTVSWNNNSTTLSKSYLSSDSEFFGSEISHGNGTTTTTQSRLPSRSHDKTSPHDAKVYVSRDGSESNVMAQRNRFTSSDNGSLISRTKSLDLHDHSERNLAAERNRSSRSNNRSLPSQVNSFHLHGNSESNLTSERNRSTRLHNKSSSSQVNTVNSHNNSESLTTERNRSTMSHNKPSSSQANSFNSNDNSESNLITAQSRSTRSHNKSLPSQMPSSNSHDNLGSNNPITEQTRATRSHNKSSPSQMKSFLSHDDSENFHTPLEERTEQDQMMDSLSISAVYMSPLSGVKKPTTPRSQEIQPHKCPTAPLPMIDYESICCCNSLEELENIVQQLSAISPPEFPALLRLARDRMNDVQAQRSLDQRSQSSLDRQDQWKIGREGTVEDSVHREEVVVPSHIQVKVTEEDTTHRQDKNSDMNTIDNNYMSSIVMAHAEKTDILENVIKERNDMQFHLSSQVEILQETLQALESDMNVNQQDSSNRISFLENAKKAAEMNLEKEQMALAVSSKEARVVLAELKSRNLEIDALGEELQRERSAHSIELQKANLVQADLRAKVDNLTNQLEIRVEETEATRKLMEMKIESKYKKLSELDKGVIYDLEEQLLSIREQLKVLSEENSLLTKQNLDLQRKSNNSFKFAEVLKEFAAAESCADALAKALAESESEMSSAVLANEQMEELLCRIMEERSLVRDENKELSEKLAEMEHELDNSHKFINNLRHLNSHKTQDYSHEKKYKEWESAKNSYEDKILGMRSHILRADTRAINEANNAAKEVTDLSLKVRKLEKLLDNRKHSSETAQSRSDVQRRSVNETAKDIEIYSDPHASSGKNSETHLTQQLSSRVSVLRANGGRAGLAAKLKKTRESIHLSQKNQATKEKTIRCRSPLQRLQGNRMNCSQARMVSNAGCIEGQENAFR